MTARKDQNVELYQGDYAIMYVRVYDRLNAYVQLSTATMSFQYEVSRSSRNETALIAKSLGDGISIDADQTGSNRGMMYIELLPEDTAKYEGKMYHEARIVDESAAINKPRVVMEGEFLLLKSTTQ